MLAPRRSWSSAIAGRRAFLDQRQVQCLGTELGLVVGGVAGIEVDRDVDGRDRAAAREHDLHAVRQGRAFDRRELQRLDGKHGWLRNLRRGRLLRRRCRRRGRLDRLRRDRRLHAGRRGAAFGRATEIARVRDDAAGNRNVFGRALARRHRQAKCGTAHPLAGRGGNARRGCGGDFLQVFLVLGRVLRIDFALRQRDRFPGKAADLLQALDRRGDRAGRGALHLVGRRAVLEEVRNDLVEAARDQRRIDSGLHPRGHRQQRDLLELLDACRHADRDLLLAHQRIVEARAAKPAEDRSRELELAGRRIVHPGNDPFAADRGGRDAVVHHLVDRRGQRRNRHRRPRRLRAARDRAEPALGLCLRGRDVDVAGKHQHGIVRTVMGAEPVLHVGQAGSVEVGHRADRGVMIRMPRREQGIELGIFLQAAGLIVAHPLLVLDNAALQIERLLGDRSEQVPHAVGLEEHGAVERAGRHRLEIVGAVEPGRSVPVRRADILEPAEEHAGRVFRTIEHQMLEQMREAGLALGLVLRPDVIPHRHRDDRRLVVLVDDHRQPVLELEHLVGDVDLLDQRRQRRGRRFGRGRRKSGRGKRSSGGEQGKAAQDTHRPITPINFGQKRRT